ncbi:MAG: HNH endonuclease family protein [Microthrixaceae bacterium]|nr:HNH endonuclease family protein [Microthrixaceae bacterium]
MTSHRGRLRWGAVMIVCVALLLALGVGLLDDDTESIDDREPQAGTESTEHVPDQQDDDPSGESTSTTNEPPAGTPNPETPSTRWQAELSSLTIAPEAPRDGYDRDLFRHWVDADGDGCNTRCEVLERQRTTSLPGLADGGWLSIYDGYSTDDPSEFDVDHVVALAEAWDSGAATWGPARREAFANDLDSGQLIAVTAATNRSKSDRDPAQWQPPNRDAWCEWGAAWIGVKAKWELTADPAEIRALTNIMRGCT